MTIVVNESRKSSVAEEVTLTYASLRATSLRDRLLQNARERTRSVTVTSKTGERFLQRCTAAAR